MIKKYLAQNEGASYSLPLLPPSLCTHPVTQNRTCCVLSWHKMDGGSLWILMSSLAEAYSCRSGGLYGFPWKRETCIHVASYRWQIWLNACSIWLSLSFSLDNKVAPFLSPLGAFFHQWGHFDTNMFVRVCRRFPSLTPGLFHYSRHAVFFKVCHFSATVDNIFQKRGVIM